jgi:hypothetical protein
LWPANTTSSSSPSWTYVSPLEMRITTVREAVFGPGNDLFIVGDTSGNISGYTNAGGWDAYLMRLDGSTGKVEWGRQWGGSEMEIPYDIATDGENLYVVVQLTHSDSTTNYIVSKRKSTDGSVIWERTLQATLSDTYWYTKPRIVIDSTGAVTVLAYTIMARISKDNALLWENDATSGYSGLGIDGTGAIYAGFPSGVIDKFNTSGTLIWKASPGIWGNALAVSSNTGSSFRLVAVSDEWNSQYSSRDPYIWFMTPGN